MRIMNNICKSAQYSTHTKLKLYRSRVLSTLMPQKHLANLLAQKNLPKTTFSSDATLKTWKR
ncbi:hypothetical protein DPMN_170123 [Dreissena polymorpha]|uniref:Uncharacterized protein n=1 Tax=Dreissena polymorpha TaxID=45954 RepID=A0A9D4IB96_DREPO|nr:hypothetical protein DPMN_170123 [Dreissena polymorpha]